MSTVLTNRSLSELFSDYRADAAQQDRDLDARREQQLPTLRSLTEMFIEKQYNLATLRDKLQSTLTQNDDLWGTKGPGFMMELNKLRKNHDEHDPIAENKLRAVLTGINQDNLGERIESFYNFLLNERVRLQQEGKSSNQAMAPGNSAFLLSLFAYWLNPAHPPIIYYFRSCLSISYLITSGLLPNSSVLNFTYDANAKIKRVLVVTNSKEHRAYQDVIQQLARSLGLSPFDPNVIEHFLYWLAFQLERKSEPAPTLFREMDNPDVLVKNVTDPLVIRDAPVAYQTSVSDTGQREREQFPNERLRVVPEPLLTQRIAEIQRHILIDEETIRHIYYALLVGHVILTGPPGTGKTELARMLPEILWSTTARTDDDILDGAQEASSATKTAYTTHVVTATDEWSTRTLISGITPLSKDGNVTYSIQYGHLTNAIRKNWSTQSDDPKEWNPALQRTPILAHGKVERGYLQEFRGQWLVIDEFNRAPIDLALGDALTALGGNDVLRVAIEGGSAELPIPQDFRIIGTLNSFDRSYLNQISEALKRRFSFVEILPPTRIQRAAEQGMVLYKALKQISHLSATIHVENDTVDWQGLVIEADSSGSYALTWIEEQSPFRPAFEAAWQLFEVIRMYRQLGTAQAITWMQRMLVTGILQEYQKPEDWIAKALDSALCDTLVDQLQVLLPDEIDVLLLYLTSERSQFSVSYDALLARLGDNPHRLYGQLLALSSVHVKQDDDEQPLLSDEQVEQIAKQEPPVIPEPVLRTLFHLDTPLYRLPSFTRRLRTFKAERGL